MRQAASHLGQLLRALQIKRLCVRTAGASTSPSDRVHSSVVYGRVVGCRTCMLGRPRTIRLLFVNHEPASLLVVSVVPAMPLFVFMILLHLFKLFSLGGKLLGQWLYLRFHVRDV